MAHNCTDETAEIARRMGAETVILNNPEERGKGYALAGVIEHLQTEPPDIVVGRSRPTLWSLSMRTAL